jgi:hypothetical protein
MECGEINFNLGLEVGISIIDVVLLLHFVYTVKITLVQLLATEFQSFVVSPCKNNCQNFIDLITIINNTSRDGPKKNYK